MVIDCEPKRDQGTWEWGLIARDIRMQRGLPPLLPGASQFSSFTRLLSPEPFAAQLLLTCSDPTAYPCPLGALTPHCQPQWSLTKGKAAASSSIPLIHCAPPFPICFAVPPRPPWQMSKRLPFTSWERQTHCVRCEGGLGQDWVGDIKLPNHRNPQPSTQIGLSCEAAMARLGKRGESVLQAHGTAARVCINGQDLSPAHPLSTPCCCGQGKLFGEIQCEPRRVVYSEQLMPGRSGVMPCELSGAARPSGTCSGIEEADMILLPILSRLVPAQDRVHPSSLDG